ncbi:MAG: hypothetical protein HC918_13750 [Oscillatoriales cyanobacterium SM2_1_8]|nr:hypothetical protein [Oscillatoriales cyanobacterium SM2_1_8]
MAKPSAARQERAATDKSVTLGQGFAAAGVAPRSLGHGMALMVAWMAGCTAWPSPGSKRGGWPKMGTLGGFWGHLRAAATLGNVFGTLGPP